MAEVAPSEPAALELLSGTDWAAVGLVAALIGGFLLANAILVRHPRQLIEARFGERAPALHSIRAHIFNRVQLQVGFLFLLLGLGCQLYARFQPPGVREFPLAWTGLLLVAVVLLELAAWQHSLGLFRRYVREHLKRRPADFESDALLARELGELFGVESLAEDTVPSYAARLRAAIGLPAPERGRAARAARGRSPLPDEEIVDT